MYQLRQTLLFILLTSVLIGYLPNKATASDPTRYTIGWDVWKPYMYEDNGNLTGLDVELLSRIFFDAGILITFKRLPWKRNLLEVEKGTVHFAAGASEADDRKHYAYFSAPYRDEKVVLVVRKGESATLPITSLADVTEMDFDLGVTRGYYYGEEYETLKRLKRFMDHVQVVTNDEQNYRKLSIGRIDGFLIDFYNLQVKLHDGTIGRSIEIHPATIYSTDIHVMFSKKTTTPEMVNAFNTSLEALKMSGKIGEITSRYVNLYPTLPE